MSTAPAQAGIPLSEPAPIVERCPLCGSALSSSQDWCLTCGAAARTRLAATPRWWLPVTLLAAIVIVSLGVLIASLVKLAG
ncbi:MAG TPA: hypothetical protein VGF95_07315 [Solirubrobacteraceae bacterium]|jgi:hypothetical protein